MGWNVVLLNNITNSTILEQRTSSTEYCIISADDIEDVPDEIRRYLIIPFIVFGIISLLSNSLVVLAIIKTRVWENQSTRLILILSVYDVFDSIITNTSLALYISLSENLSCHIKISMVGVSIFLTNSIFSMVAVISFDRLMRVTWMQNYSTRFNARRYKTVLAIQVILTMLATILWIMGVLSRKPGQAAFYTNLVNIPVYLATLIFYLVSICKLAHIQDGSSVATETRKLTKMASIYVLAYFIITSPAIFFLVFFQRILKDISLWQTSIITFFILYLPNINGVFNAVMFLLKNRECRRWLRGVFARWRSRFRRRRVEADNAAPPPAD